MINKLALTITNSETFTTIEFSPNDARVPIFDDALEFKNYIVDWRLPQNEYVDELIRGQKVSLQCITRVSFDEIAKAALYEDGTQIKHVPTIVNVAFEDVDVYEALEAAGKLEYLTNQTIAAYSIMGGEDKHLRIF